MADGVFSLIQLDMIKPAEGVKITTLANAIIDEITRDIEINTSETEIKKHTKLADYVLSDSVVYYGNLVNATKCPPSDYESDVFVDPSCKKIYPTFRKKRLYIPLMFWFCINPGLAIPLIALQYHDVRLDFKFRN